MCGILGVIDRNPQARLNADQLAAARDQLTHRGPDEAGLWLAPGIGLAHRRLSIQDLTHGQQPMLARDRVGPSRSAHGTDAEFSDTRFALVFNGEIYNHHDLRPNLERDGQQFTGAGDTETLFALLNRDPDAALEQINGMFAFAHWDAQARTALLVRDRMGQKPLYWAVVDDRLIFASELKAVLALTPKKFALDPVAVDSFFARGYIPAPRTIFRGIHKLPAAHALRFDAKAWSWRVEPYWSLQPQAFEGDQTMALDRMQSLLDQAVRRRLLSDVPLGTFLSGGIDSSLITLLAAEALREEGQPLTAFGLSFGEDPQADELPFAAQIADHVGAELKSAHVGTDNWLDLLDAGTTHFDEPFGNPTQPAMLQLCRLAREHMTVVLSGQGADELMAGYPGRYQWTVDPRRSQGQPPQGPMPGFDDRLEFLQRSSFIPWPGARQTLFNPQLAQRVREQEPPFAMFEPFWAGARNRDLLNRVLITDSQTNLPDYLVCIEERLSMAASLEARNPFLDHEVVEFMLSLPPEMKMQPGTSPNGKRLLKELALRSLPASAIDRPKRGFTPPLQAWIQGSRAELAQRFTAQRDALMHVLSEPFVQLLASGQLAPAMSMPSFYALCFSNWLQAYGEHIDWSAEYASSSQAAPAAPVCPSQSAWRDQNPAAVALGRWFVQGLKNFPAGSSLRVLADEGDDYWRSLTEDQGLRPDDVAGSAVAVGLKSAELLVGDPSIHNALLVIPFDAANKQAVLELGQTLTVAGVLKGHQPVPLPEGPGPDGLWIARMQRPEAQPNPTPQIVVPPISAGRNPQAA